MYLHKVYTSSAVQLFFFLFPARCMDSDEQPILLRGFPLLFKQVEVEGRQLDSIQQELEISQAKVRPWGLTEGRFFHYMNVG